MAVCLIFLDRLADAGQNAYLYLEAFTRKIIALILGRVKYFFAQFGKFKIGRELIDPKGFPEWPGQETDQCILPDKVSSYEKTFRVSL